MWSVRRRRAGSPAGTASHATRSCLRDASGDPCRDAQSALFLDAANRVLHRGLHVAELVFQRRLTSLRRDLTTQLPTRHCPKDRRDCMVANHTAPVLSSATMTKSVRDIDIKQGSYYPWEYGAGDFYVVEIVAIRDVDTREETEEQRDFSGPFPLPDGCRRVDFGVEPVTKPLSGPLKPSPDDVVLKMGDTRVPVHLHGRKRLVFRPVE